MEANRIAEIDVRARPRAIREYKRVRRGFLLFFHVELGEWRLER